MGAITRIAWCDATFNPWVGCLRVSTACDRCYAAALSWRYGWRDGKGRDLWDVRADRKRTSSVYWRDRSKSPNARPPEAGLTRRDAGPECQIPDCARGVVEPDAVAVEASPDRRLVDLEGSVEHVLAADEPGRDRAERPAFPRSGR